MMKKRIAIFLFIDALGWKTVKETKFLQDLLPHRRKIQMQFGYSCTAIPTILSGLPPSEHQHLGLFNYSPERSPFKHLGFIGKYLMHPRSFWSRGRVRNVVSRLVKKLFGFTGYFQLYQADFSRLHLMDYSEKKDLFVAQGMAPHQNLYDYLEQTGIPFHISNWRKPAFENLETGLQLVEQEKVDFMFLYVANFDALEHDHPEEMDVLMPMLEHYEKAIRALMDAGKKHYENCEFTVFSDHGMTPLTGTIDPKTAIEKTDLVFGKDYGACFDSTVIRLFYHNKKAQEVIEKTLAPFVDKLRLVTKEEEKEYGVYREDRFFGNAIYLAKPGIQIVPSDMALKPLNGMHGYDPADAYSEAAILSTEPIPEYANSVGDYFRIMKESAQKEVLN